MTGQFITRFLSSIMVLFGITVFSFVLIHLIPGDPVKIMLGDSASNEQIVLLREQLGLDQPLLFQYLRYMEHIFQGDFGTSIKTGRPVIQEITERLPYTAELAVFSIVIASGIGLCMGMLAAKFRHTFVDTFIMFLATLGVSIPGFWLCLLMIVLFTIKLGWFPIANGTGLKDVIIPAVTLGMLASTIITRLTRSGMVEVMANDYIRTARAKGLSEFKILFRHGFRNVMLPVISVVGLQIASLLGGAVIIEQVFNWPGLGTLAIGAISSRDFPLIQGFILFMGVTYVSINLLVDIITRILDPRVQQSLRKDA